MRRLIDFDMVTGSGISCALCMFHAHIQFSAIGTLLHVLFDARYGTRLSPLPPFRLQAVLLLTRFVADGIRFGAYPDTLQPPADLADRGTFIQEQIIVLEQRQLAAQRQWQEEHPTAWQRLKKQFGSGKLMRDSSPDSSATSMTSLSLRRAPWAILSMLTSLRAFF